MTQEHIFNQIISSDFSSDCIINLLINYFIIPFGAPSNIAYNFLLYSFSIRSVEKFRPKSPPYPTRHIHLIDKEYLFFGSIVEILITVPSLSSGCESYHLFNPPWI